MSMNYEDLVGQNVFVKKRGYHSADSDPCPWAYGEQEMRVEANYPRFLVVTVLPHRNPRGFGLSTAYKTTLLKLEIETGIISISLNGGQTE